MKMTPAIGTICIGLIRELPICTGESMHVEGNLMVQQRKHSVMYIRANTLTREVSRSSDICCLCQEAYNIKAAWVA